MENIKIGVQIDANTKEATADAKKYHDQLKQAAETAKSIRVGGGQAAPTAAPSYKAAKQPTGAVTQGQPVGSQEVMQYGSLRGTAAATGASARDFANQAQGLSGLVRLYAIYAANVYAVGAAFMALSRAMDTTNMIRGLDQIGAASGVALGGLSKQLVAATGGAISLREAMQATVKVTAAGLGQENVIRLGQVAAKASQALGVDMGDAINRLSRGITKLEPELLDELGIFTKIDPAVQKYALSVGKSAAQLTDFERRQAFANAVLEEGEKKFAAIKVDANPYNKLAASLQNIAQSGLELVNKVLAPLINLLSSSPTALVTALLGVVGSIVKQAIPAFGLFRQNVQKANEEANQAAQARAKNAVATQKDLNDKLLALTEARANKEVDALDAAEAKFAQLKQKGVASRTVQNVLKTESTTDITEKQIASIERAARSARKKGLEEEAKVYDELAATIRSGQKAEEDYLRAKAKGTDALIKDVQSKRTIIGLNAALADSAEKASFKQQIVSNAAYAGSLIGPINAIKLMNAEINASGVSLTKLSAGLLLARGSLAAFAGAAATVGTVLMSAFAVITAVVGIGTLLATLFTNTAKESKATSEAFGQLEESTKNLSNSIDVINNKPYLEQFDAQSISARANALEGFTVALQKSNQAAQAELAAMNWLDKSVDIVKMLWSGDVQSKLNKETASGLSKAFSSALVSNSDAGKIAKQSIANILKIDPNQITDLDSIDNALSKLSKSEAATAIAQINGELDKLSKTDRASANALAGLEEGFKKVAELRKKFIAEFIPQDTFSQFGAGLVSTSFELEAALKNPQTQLQAIKRTFEELKNIGGISPDLLIGLEDVSKKASELQVLTASLAETELKSEQLINRQKQLQAQLDKQNLRGDKWREVNAELEQVRGSLKDLENYKETNLKVKLDLQQSIDASQKVINEAQIRVFEVGSQIVASKLSAEFAKAGQTITSGFASLLSGTETGIKLRAQAEKIMLDVQRHQIIAQQAQIVATAQNTIALKERIILDKLQAAKTAAPDDAAVIGKEITALRNEITGLQKAIAPGGSYDILAKQRAKELRATGESGVTPEALNLASSLQGSRAALANLGAQSYVTQLNLQKDLREFADKAGVAERQREIDRLKAARDLLIVNGEVFNQTNETALIRRQELDAQIRQKEEALRQADAVAKTNALEFIRSELAKSQVKNKEELVNNLAKEIGLVREISEQSKDTTGLKEQTQQQKDILDLIQLRGRVQLELFDRETNRREQQLNLRAQEVDAQQKSFDILSRTINLSPQYIAAEEEILARKRAQLEFDRQQQQLGQTRGRGLQELDTQAQTVLAGATGEDGLTQEEISRLAQIQAKRDEINKAYETGISLQTTILALANSEAISKKQIADEQNRYNKLLTDTQSIGSSLQAVFAGFGSSVEKFGQGLSTFIVGFGEISVQVEKNAKAVSLLESALNNPEITAEERIKFEGELGRARTKQTKDEISGYAKLAGAAKSMFKEKSAGAKAFGALEKALHIARLAMDIKELILSVSTGKSKMAQNLAEMFVVGKKAVLEAYAAPFPVGFATGAMMAAIVAAIIGKAVGGGGKASFVPTAATRQETQGTAFAYNETGEKVQVRSGVFGNESEKTESIKNSLQILRDNSINGLKYDDRLLKSFEKLSRSILEISRSVYTRASNLRTGRISGIPEGTVKDTTKLPGAIGTVAGGIAGAAIGATIGGTITGGTLASIASVALGPVGFILGAVLGKVLGGLFGTKITQTVTDSGIKLTGTINDLTNRVEGAVQGFATLQITKKSFFGGTSVTPKEVPVDVAKEITVAVSDAIGAGAQTILELADILGVERQKILTLFETLKVDGEVGKISFKGKSLEEINQEFGAVIGGILSDLAEKSFSPLIQVFRQAGEDALQTATRLAVNKRSVEQIFANLTDGTIRDLSIQTTESLLEISGGLDKFAESASKYAENFLTEEERLAPTRKAVNAELDRLGLSSIKTRAQFKAAIDFLIKNDLTASETFTSLMNVSEGFAAVTESTEKTQDALKKAYDTRVQELTKAKTDFEGFAKSIRDFTLSLKTGALSPLTPQQQYDQLKAEFLSISALAQTGDVTAIGKLQGISQSFLDASKKMFASSAEYITDFNTVLDANESTATFAELQVKVATDTLDQIKLSVQGLITIDQTLQTLPVALTGLGDNLTKALADYTAASDSNLNGLFEKVTETLVESRGIPGINLTTRTTEIEYFKNVIVGSFEEILNRYEERRVAAGIPVSEAEPLPSSIPTAIQTTVTQVGLFGTRVSEVSQRVLTVSESLDALDKAIRRRLETVTTPAPTPTSPLSLAGAIPDIPSGALWFARGGVVDGMTPFRYNEGVGVMGEAGPEAIMPLHRMPNGDLGVMSAGNDVLAKQLAELNKQVQQLTQVVADGAIMNAQATERNTEQITQAVTDTVESSNYQAKLTNRTRVV